MRLVGLLFSRSLLRSQLSSTWLSTLEAHGIGAAILFGLKAAEYGPFCTDLALFAVFPWRTAKRTIRNL
jgi:hypothetical protein